MIPHQLLASRNGSSARSPRRPVRSFSYRPRLEGLEHRWLPSTLTVTTIADGGPGSLRQAILDANGSSGVNTIDFQIGSGLAVIQPRTPLPASTNPVVIDGTTQPGYRGTPLVVLDGTLAGTSNANGLQILGGDSTIQGLVIGNFHNVGIFLGSFGGDLVTGCYLGTDFTGTQYAGNGTGVQAQPQDLQRDVISGNLISGNLTGVFLFNTDDNRVVGNRIGTNADGLSAQGNGGDGITLAAGASFNAIGGTEAGAGNEIAANQGNGIRLTDSSTAGNLIEGNAIGTDPSGTLALGNRTNGVAVVNASNNTIGGTAAGAGNLIAFNGNDGVLVDTGTGNAI